MANVLFYDPLDLIVNNKVTQYLKSVNTPDYLNVNNCLINPDISNVINFPMKYWKVNNNLVIEMSQSEKNSIDTFLEAKTIKEKKYKVVKYSLVGQILVETWYFTDNGDGTYKDKVEETLYEYESNVILLSKEISKFYYDGSVYSYEKFGYFKNSNNEYIEKRI